MSSLYEKNGYVYFSSKPDREDVKNANSLNECQWNGCSKRINATVRFGDPREYVCYCSNHGKEAHIMDRAKNYYNIS